MIEIQEFVFNPFQENTFILFDETKECIIIDPGCSTNQEGETIKSFLKDRELDLVKMVFTHGHLDHVCGAAFIHDEFGLFPQCHSLDQDLLEQVVAQGRSYGFELQAPPTPGKFLDEGDHIGFGNSSLKVLHTPGHSRGHIVLHNEAQKFLITGDVLFYGSIGRTDLHGGDYDTLIRSIQNKILPLADETKVYSGHGPSTTVGIEKLSNPYLS